MIADAALPPPPMMPDEGELRASREEQQRRHARLRDGEPGGHPQRAEAHPVQAGGEARPRALGGRPPRSVGLLRHRPSVRPSMTSLRFAQCSANCRLMPIRSSGCGEAHEPGRLAMGGERHAGPGGRRLELDAAVDRQRALDHPQCEGAVGLELGHLDERRQLLAPGPAVHLAQARADPAAVRRPPA